MKPFTTVAMVFLFLVAGVHLVRLFTKFEVMIAGNLVPVWVSAPGALVFGVLGFLVYRELRR